MTRDGFDNIPKRIKLMDEAGVDMPVISCIFPYNKNLSADDGVSIAGNVNKSLSDLVTKYPERLPSFAILPFQAPIAFFSLLIRTQNQALQRLNILSQLR